MHWIRKARIITGGALIGSVGAGIGQWAVNTYHIGFTIAFALLGAACMVYAIWIGWDDEEEYETE